MNEIAIRVEHLSKLYRIGENGGGIFQYKSLRETFTKAFARRSSSAAKTSSSDTIWALQDVSFEIKRGEAVGVIGRNGAGKSTLLKILSRITEPTEGRAEIHGRVASLLEVGTGFHAELTGRENIYLNAAILGMKKREIEKKFDEIIAFAEIEKFINTPVKHYSSGMYMRLAFAVAAHLDPEILLVDEVLAVGDAVFQKKCLGKMDDIAKEGRTVLFVSHNLIAIRSICSRALLIGYGRIIQDGQAPKVLSQYLNLTSGEKAEEIWNDSDGPGNERIRLKAVRIVSNSQKLPQVDIDQEISVEVEYLNFQESLRNIGVNMYLLDNGGAPVFSTINTPAANLLPEEWFGKPHPRGHYRSSCKIPANFLNEGVYFISVYIVTWPLNVEATTEQILSFRVIDTGVMREPGGGSYWAGVVRPRLAWQTEFLNPL